MPIEPVVKLFDANTLVEYSDQNIINFGEVKAGDESAHIVLHLWNNKGGAEDASTMRDVDLFILDGNDAKNEPIVKEGWLHTKCISGGALTFTRLRDINTVKISAAGMPEGEISGTINNGENTATTNFAKIEIFAKIVENVLEATHGDKPFSLAFRYFFT